MAILLTLQGEVVAATLTAQPDPSDFTFTGVGAYKIALVGTGTQVQANFAVNDHILVKTNQEDVPTFELNGATYFYIPFDTIVGKFISS